MPASDFHAEPKPRLGMVSVPGAVATDQEIPLGFSGSS
jgi:hypothetical protein